MRPLLILLRQLAMARRIDTSNFHLGIPHTTEQRQACEDFKRIFGWKAESVESDKRSCGLRGAFSLKVRVGLREEIRFTLAQGVLVGIFPKKRW
jgi:hypothetical protein